MQKVKRYAKAKERLIIAGLFLRGHRQNEIARKIQRTESYVAIELKKLHDDWRTQSNIDFAQAKAIELAKIDHLERTYWRGWFLSLAESKSVTVRGYGQKADEKDKTKPVSVERSERTEKTYGDPRYLQGIQWCIERRVKMFGFDQPMKFELVDEIRRKAQEYGLTESDFAENPILSEIASRYNLGELGAQRDQAIGQA